VDRITAAGRPCSSVSAVPVNKARFSSGRPTTQPPQGPDLRETWPSKPWDRQGRHWRRRPGPGMAANTHLPIRQARPSTLRAAFVQKWGGDSCRPLRTCGSIAFRWHTLGQRTVAQVVGARPQTAGAMVATRGGGGGTWCDRVSPWLDDRGADHHRPTYFVPRRTPPCRVWPTPPAGRRVTCCSPGPISTALRAASTNPITRLLAPACGCGPTSSMLHAKVSTVDYSTVSSVGCRRTSPAGRCCASTTRSTVVGVRSHSWGHPRPLATLEADLASSPGHHLAWAGPHAPGPAAMLSGSPAWRPHM